MAKQKKDTEVKAEAPAGSIFNPPEKPLGEAVDMVIHDEVQDISEVHLPPVVEKTDAEAVANVPEVKETAKPVVQGDQIIEPGSCYKNNA